MNETDFFNRFEKIGWDYQGAFEGAVEDIALAAETKAEDGNVLSRRLENLFNNAQSSSEFVHMQQLAARLGDICCNNPAMSEMVNNSSYLQESLYGHSDNDGHNHGDKLSNKRDDDDETDPKTGKKKKKTYSWLSTR
ncbi:MAG: hypothetical protein ACREF7_01195 [Candidatus Saccharimonadales bacterium]